MAAFWVVASHLVFALLLDMQAQSAAVEAVMRWCLAIAVTAARLQCLSNDP